MDESLLTCPVCLDIFRDPVNLPCAHTYCRPCLNDIANRKHPDPRTPWQNNLSDHERYQKQKKRVFECPECRQVAVLDDKGIAGLPKNYLVASMAQKFAPDQKYKGPSVPCDACESTPPRNAVRSCTQCQTSYCKFCCEELHPRRGALAKHELFDPREKGTDQHLFSTKILNDLFCEKCQVVLRREAELAVASHKGMGHTLVGIRQAISQQMEGVPYLFPPEVLKNRSFTGRDAMDESLLTCPVCLDIFRDPVNLPCAHTYCRPCLNDIANRKHPDPRTPWQNNLSDHERYQKQKKRVFECPECRQVAVLDDKGIAGLPKNYLVASMAQKFAPDQKYKGPSVPCDACESTPPRNAVRSCTQCQTSYCKFCCEELHPRRGALAKHELFDPREKGTDQHLFSTKILNDLFCEKCQVVLRREAELAVASHKGMGHTLVGIRQAISQQMTSLKASILDMETVERDLAKRIGDKESEFEITKDAECSKLREINREMERIGKLIQDRQTRLRAETKLGFAGYFIQTESELDKARQKHVQATGLIGEGRTLMEANGQGTKSEHVTNIIALKKRMEQAKDKLAFTFSDTQKVSQLPATVDAVLRRIQSALTEATAAGHIDGIILDTMTGGDTCDERVQIPVAGRRWNASGASIVLEWSHFDGRVFDIQLQCDVGTERTTREIFGLRDNGVVVTRLWHATTYRVSIWVQGRPGTKAIVDVRTLPAITSDVLFDTRKASKDVVVDSDGMRLFGKGAGHDVKSQEITRKGYPSIAGTFGLRELTGSYNYWELKVQFRMGHLLKTAHEWAFDLGICCAHTAADGDDGSRPYTTYTCRAVKYGKKFARLEFGVDGNMNLLPARDLEWTIEDFFFHFGFFLNQKAMTFSVLDNARNSILYTFKDVKVTESCLPMFSVSKKKNTIQEMMLGVRSQATVPNVIYEQLV